ncbi:MAG: hypothetical protein [Caudoviricetes sp.]|nr:MAG: hypothetical protein [Caudoviricetes sp.]
MFYSLLVLQAIAELGGVGVSMTAIEKVCVGHQYMISRYKLRAILKDLQSVGMVGRNKNHFFLRLLGANIATADNATANGYEVMFCYASSNMPLYQTEIL